MVCRQSDVKGTKGALIYWKAQTARINLLAPEFGI